MATIHIDVDRHLGRENEDANRKKTDAAQDQGEKVGKAHYDENATPKKSSLLTVHHGPVRKLSVTFGQNQEAPNSNSEVGSAGGGDDEGDGVAPGSFQGSDEEVEDLTTGMSPPTAGGVSVGGDDDDDDDDDDVKSSALYVKLKGRPPTPPGVSHHLKKDAL